jgi:hypothetical protein
VTDNGVFTLTLEEFTYSFVNTFPPEEAAAAYDRYAVPETGQIFFAEGVEIWLDGVLADHPDQS